MNSLLASVMLWPCDWAPNGWHFCNGQSFPINNDNSALYSLLGTAHGGDGVNNFLLPNMPNVTTASGAEPRYIICIMGVYPSRF